MIWFAYTNSLPTTVRRRQVIIRERLKFPSGFSTAVLISILHGQETGQHFSQQQMIAAAKGGFASLVPRPEGYDEVGEATTSDDTEATNSSEVEENPRSQNSDWAGNMRLLITCFLISGLYTVCTYFVPILHNLPIFGQLAAESWLWTLNPSLAYIGQGIIMGTETTLHMTLGAVVGWGILSPMAKASGWAPGPVGDWENGSKGWIVWISLAIMLVDAIISLAYVVLYPFLGPYVAKVWLRLRDGIGLGNLPGLSLRRSHQYSPIPSDDLNQSDWRDSGEDNGVPEMSAKMEDLADAPPEQLVGSRIVTVGLILSILLCIITVHMVFGRLVPLYATVIAVLMALVLSIMGVRALGETDLNPVSGISKLAQLFFALIIPQSNKSSVLINLIAGAIVSFPPSNLSPLLRY